MPTGELKRSIGHWNPVEQQEAFLCVEGAVVMLVADRGSAILNVVECGPGDVVVMPPGGWHLTLVVSDAAIVDNCYTHASRAIGGFEKYLTGPEPIETTMVRAGPGGALSLINYGRKSIVLREIAPTLASSAQSLGIRELPGLLDGCEGAPTHMSLELRVEPDGVVSWLTSESS